MPDRLEPFLWAGKGCGDQGRVKRAGGEWRGLVAQLHSDIISDGYSVARAFFPL